MKLSLLLTLVVLVCVSQQQRSYGWSPRHLSAAYFSPNTFARPGLNYVYFNSQEQEFDDEEGANFDDESDPYPDIQARRPSFKASTSSRVKPQKKLFVPNNFFSLASALGNGLAVSALTTSTTTNYVIATATATVATVQSCIGVNQFLVFAGATPVTSSQPCSRRRRLAAEIVDNLRESSVTIIEPSSVSPLETSAAPPLHSNDNRREFHDLSSSLLDQQDFYSQQQRQIQGRAQSQSLFKVVVTLSSTFTSYTFATTTIKKSYTVGNTQPAGLLCLPAGYTVC